MIYEFDTIDSTNEYLKSNYETLENYTMVIAKHQTKGRGRITRLWYDDGKSLLASILLKNVSGEIKNLSLISSYAIFNALTSLGLKCSIKWPNDIYIDDEKVCGILIETILSESFTAIIGFGINTNTQFFPVGINATSIYNKLNKEISNLDLARKVLKEFKKAYQDVPFSEVIKVNKENSYLMNKRVSLDYYGDGIKGKVIDLLENGNVVIDTGDKKVEIFSGELTLIK